MKALQLFALTLVFFNVGITQIITHKTSFREDFYENTYNKTLIRNNKVLIITIDNYLDGLAVANKEIFYFDTLGLIQKIENTNGKNEIEREYYFEYDSLGGLIFRKLIDPLNIINSQLRYFDERHWLTYKNKNLVKDSIILVGISSFASKVQEYNNNGYLINETRYDSGRIFSIYELTLNKTDQIISSNYRILKNTNNFSFSQGMKYTSDRLGNVIEVKSTNPNYKSLIEYTYDANNNLIERRDHGFYYFRYTYYDNGLVASEHFRNNLDSKSFKPRAIYYYTFRQ
jgi:hypothetical protein